MPSSSTRRISTPGSGRAVGVQPLVARRLGRAPGDRRMLGAAEAARRDDPEAFRALADRGRHRRTAQADHRHQRHVPRRIEVGMVEQAREEQRRALTGRDTAPRASPASTRSGSHTSMRWIALAAVHRHQQRREHADAVADRRAGDHRRRDAHAAACRGPRPRTVGCHRAAGSRRRSCGASAPRPSGRTWYPTCTRRAPASSGSTVATCVERARRRAASSKANVSGPGSSPDDRDPFEVRQVGAHACRGWRGSPGAPNRSAVTKRLHARAAQDVRRPPSAP